jgi:hypothetical protein
MRKALPPLKPVSQLANPDPPSEDEEPPPLWRLPTLLKNCRMLPIVNIQAHP